VALTSTRKRFSKWPASPTVIVKGSSERTLLPSSSTDIIITDPPYHDDVQYHELSLPFRAWAKLSKRKGAGEAVAIPHFGSLAEHAKYRGVLTNIFCELRRILKPGGRLIFSYANRESAAWVNLFAALQDSGLRAVAYTIVHSENEKDYMKQKGRACNLDLFLELVTNDSKQPTKWSPQPVFKTNEERYLMAVGNSFLSIGNLMNGWEVDLVKQLKSEIFVRAAGQNRKKKRGKKAKTRARLAGKGKQVGPQ